MDLSHPLLANTDDPPPIPDSYPQLQRLERALQCPVCKDLYEAPVSIPCGHSFCSQCIRSYLDSQKDKKCPTCGESATEGSIRRNRALEEMAESWEEARPSVIKMTASKRPAVSGRASSSSSPPRTSKRRRKSSSSEVELLSYEDQGKCPICEAEMPISAVDSHIERNCAPVKVKANGGNQKSDWNKLFRGVGKGKDPELKRITKPNYALATPATLRSLLTEHGLPTTGDKDTLVARVQEWIVLYNANLDREHPRALSSLRTQLANAEGAKRRDRERGRDDAVKELGTKEGLAKHARVHHGEFERLRREIMQRDARRSSHGSGSGEGDTGGAEESAIEVE